MGNLNHYAGILSQVLRQEASQQPRLVPIRLAAVCDEEAGEFLLIGTGWEKSGQRVDTIYFHARLCDHTVIIETDHTEAGLAGSLREAGIAAEDLTSGAAFNHGEPSPEPVAA